MSHHKVAIVTPVLPSGRDDGLTIPLRHIIRACENTGNVVLAHVLRSARPDLAGIVGIIRGSECYSSASLRANAVFPTFRDAVGGASVSVGFLGSTAGMVSGVPGTRRICIVQDSISRISQRNGQLDKLPAGARWAATFTNMRYERRAYSQMDAIVVTSLAESRYLQEIGVQCPIVVNPNGVEVPSHIPDSSPDMDILLLGNYADQRNVRCAERALVTAELLSRNLGRRVRVLLVGWSASRISAPAVGVDLQVQEDVVDLSAVLGRARCFLSIDPDSTGIKNSVLTMLAAGIPGIVTKEVAEGFGNPAAGNGLIIKPNDAAMIAQAVEAVVKSDRLWQSGREQAYLLARQYSWQAYESRIETLIDPP